MLYVASAQPPTVQLNALRARFLAADREQLIVNKLNRLEIFELDDDGQGLTTSLVVPVHAAIAAVTAVQLEGQATSSLVVLTTSLQLFAITYSPTAPHIITTSTTSILELFGRLSDNQVILVDPARRCLLVHAYNGLVRIVPLTPAPPAKARKGSKSAARTSEAGSPTLDLSRGYNVRLPSLNVTSIAFLPPTTDAGEEDEDEPAPPAIALIYKHHSERMMLETHVVDLDEKELGDGPLDEQALEDPGSEIVMPVQGEEGEEDGVIVVGEESLSWVGLSSQVESSKGKRKAGEGGKIKCRLPVGSIQAWVKVDNVPNRYLLSDVYGKLLVVEIARSSSGRVAALQTRDLGDTASPTSLVFLSDTLLYLSSRFGDSQLIRLPPATLATSSSSKAAEAMDIEGGEHDGIQLVASFASLAPIIDCCVVAGEGGGASHVVTCSGAYKGGSLRVVRQGVGLSELANLEMEGIQRLWSLKLGSTGDDLLVLGFFNETRVLSLTSVAGPDAEDEIEEVELAAFAGDEPTLLACSVGGLLVQVTTAGASYSREDGSGAAKWTTEGRKKVTLAAAEGGHVLLAVEGGVLVLLGVQDGQLVQLGTTQLDNEVACLDVSQLGGQLVATVALWTLNTILLISLPTLSTISSQTLTTSYLIRSVLLVTFSDSVTTLFAGLGDGSLSSFVVDSNGSISKGSEKSVTLGTKPLVMASFRQKGAVNVFVSSDRPTVISRANDRLVYSSVNLQDINAFVPFSSSAYPSSLALASPSGLRIGRIEDIQRVDIRAIPFDEDEPRKIAHDPKSRTFGVVCLRRDVNRVTGEQTSVGSVKVLDGQTFEVLADVPLQPNEDGQSIVVVVNGESSVFVVGTAAVIAGEEEPSKGRLLVFAEEQEQRSFKVVNEEEIAGCPYALAAAGDGHFAAAVNSKVIAYSLDASTRDITAVAEWGGAFVALALVSTGPSQTTLLVGDALRSVSVLHFTTTPAYALEETARDYDAHYMSALEAIGDGEEDELIGAETDHNLFTLRKEKTGGTTRSIVVDDTALAPRGVFHLGEMVSKFRRGSLVQQLGSTAGVASPRLIFGTSAGSVGIIAELDSDSSKLLSDLERNMRRVLDSVGGLKQEDFRSFKSERQTSPPAGFIDGNFVEQFAELSAEDVERVMEGGNEHERLGVSAAEVLRVVEEVARLH